MTNAIPGSEGWKVLKIYGDEDSIKFGKITYPDPDWTKHLDNPLSYPYVEITITETGEKINSVYVVRDPKNNVWEITVRGEGGKK